MFVKCLRPGTLALALVAAYFPDAERGQITGGRLKARHGEYDWKLNGL